MKSYHEIIKKQEKLRDIWQKENMYIFNLKWEIIFSSIFFVHQYFFLGISDNITASNKQNISKSLSVYLT